MTMTPALPAYIPLRLDAAPIKFSGMVEVVGVGEDCDGVPTEVGYVVVLLLP